MHPQIVWMGFLGLCFALGCTDKPTSPATPSDSASAGDSGPIGPEMVFCTAWLDRSQECNPAMTAEERAGYQSNCENLRRERAAHWLPDFIDAFAACTPTIACNKTDDMVTLCGPVALAAVNNDQLPAAILELCPDRTQACFDAVVAGQVTGDSVAAQCMRRWVECDGIHMTGADYWGQDDCITVLALDADSQTAAAACLPLTCTEVTPCLRQNGTFGF